MLTHPGAQAGENIAHKRIAMAREPVMHPFAIALHLHQAGAPQPGEMPRDLGLIEAERAVEIADAKLALGQQVQ